LNFWPIFPGLIPFELLLDFLELLLDIFELLLDKMNPNSLLHIDLGMELLPII